MLATPMCPQAVARVGAGSEARQLRSTELVRGSSGARVQHSREGAHLCDVRHVKKLTKDVDRGVVEDLLNEGGAR